MSTGQQFVDALDGIPETHAMDNCSLCKFYEDRNAHPCRLEGPQWCEHGWHWEKSQGPGYMVDAIVCICPLEKEHRAHVASEQAKAIGQERAHRLAAQQAQEERVLAQAAEIMDRRGRA